MIGRQGELSGVCVNRGRKMERNLGGGLQNQKYGTTLQLSFLNGHNGPSNKHFAGSNQRPLPHIIILLKLHPSTFHLPTL